MQEKLLVLINEMMEENDLSTIESLDNSLHLREDLKLDSLLLAELTVKVEFEFDVDIFEDGIVSTIGEVKSKLNIG